MNLPVDLQDNWLVRVYKTSLILVVISLPLHTTSNNIILILAAVISLVVFVKQKEINKTLSILPVAMFFFYLISIPYSQNIAEAIESLEVGSLYFIVPFIFFLSGHLISKKFSDDLLKIFALMVLLMCTVAYLRIVFQTGTFYSTSNGDFTYYDPFSRFSFADFLSFHPTYLSMYLLFAVSIAFEKLNTSIVVKITIGILVAFYLIILSSKNQLIIFLPLVSFLVWKHAALKRSVKIVIMVFLIIALAFVSSQNPQIKYRFNNEINTATGDRELLWSNGIEIISKNILVGVGIGDRKDVMNAQLLEKGKTNLLNYNLHNQFLDFLLSFGLVGLLTFTGILIAPFVYKADSIFVIFILIIATSALTESILLRQKGLCFFTFFYGLQAMRLSLVKGSK